MYIYLFIFLNNIFVYFAIKPLVFCSADAGLTIKKSRSGTVEVAGVDGTVLHYRFEIECNGRTIAFNETIPIVAQRDTQHSHRYLYVQTYFIVKI